MPETQPFACMAVPVTLGPLGGDRITGMPVSPSWPLCENTWFWFLRRGASLCYSSEHAPSVLSFQHFPVPDSATFSICPGGEHPAVKSSSLPCWDIMPDVGPSVLDTAMLQKQILLGFSPVPGADECSQCWSLPAIIRREFPRQSVAVPCGTLKENGFSTRYFTQV